MALLNLRICHLLVRNFHAYHLLRSKVFVVVDHNHDVVDGVDGGGDVYDGELEVVLVAVKVVAAMPRIMLMTVTIATLVSAMKMATLMKMKMTFVMLVLSIVMSHSDES